MLDLLEYVVAASTHGPDPDRLPDAARSARDETIVGHPAARGPGDAQGARRRRVAEPRRRAAARARSACGLPRTGARFCRGQSAVRGAAARDAGGRSRRKCRGSPRDDHRAPRGAHRPPRARRTRRAPACFGRGPVVSSRFGHRARRPRRRVRSRLDPARPRAEGVRPTRSLRLRRRRRVSLQPRADPRRRVRVHSEGASSRAPRAFGFVARRPHRRDRLGRRDHRLPPGTGLPVPGRARPDRFRRRTAGATRRPATRASRPPSPRPLRTQHGRVAPTACEPTARGRRPRACGTAPRPREALCGTAARSTRRRPS